jgi:hypothetical protein
MESRVGIAYLLKAKPRYVSFHATLRDAQEAGQDFPIDTDLVVHSTSGASVAWYYDWGTKAWERGR